MSREVLLAVSVLASCYPSAFEAPGSGVPLPSWWTLNHDSTALRPSSRLEDEVKIIRLQ